MTPPAAGQPGAGARSTRRQARRMAALLGVAGALHWVRPEPFDRIVPRSLPGTARFWTLASGVAELGTAALLAAPSTRRLGGAAAEALFIGVYPANVKMAADWWGAGTTRRTIALARLPLQVPLIVAADRIRRG